MKLAMTLLVKDEIDVIKSHIAFHLPKIDILIIMDNCSTDGTYEYLQEQKEKSDKIVLLTQASKNYAQNSWVPRMVRYATNLGADWVINSDADEFFIGDLKSVIESANNDGYNMIYPKGSHFYITECDFINSNPVKRMVYRDPLTVKYEHDKVIHSTLGFITLSQGNHWVVHHRLISANILHTDKIRLFHYPERSFDQFVMKYVADVSDIKFKQMGYIWQQRYAVYKEKGKDGLLKLYEESVITAQQIVDKKLEKDITLREII